MLPLRDYQREALAAIASAEAGGCRRQMVVLPTGSGKTIIFSHLIARILTSGGGRALVLAHRDELIQQTVEKVHAVWPGAPIGVVKAERDETGPAVTVGSVQTLSRPARLERFIAAAGGDLRLIVTDEAHHAPSVGFIRIYDALRAGDGPLHVGFTATPQRGDKLALDTVFDRVVYHRGIKDMVRDGWLVPPKGRVVSCGVSLDGVHMRGSDFAEGELDARINTDAVNTAIARTWLQHGQNRVTLAFTTSVAHAHALAKTVNGLARKTIAGALDASTPDAERRRLIDALRTGKLRFLSNCAVLTEGFDAPDVSCVLVARPTLSTAFYTQMVGRGLRPWPAAGKKDCLVLDVVGSSRRQSLITLPVLFGLAPSSGEGRPGPVGVGKRSRELDLASETLDVDLLKLRQRYAWVAIQAGLFVLSLPNKPDEPRRRLAVTRTPTGWAAEYQTSSATAGRTAETLYNGEGDVAREYAFGVAEAWVSSGPLARFVETDARWRTGGEGATEAQIRALHRMGVKPEPGLGKGAASDLITAAIARREMEPATRRQIWRLRQLGIPIPENLGKHAAGQLIGQAARASETAH